MKIAFNSEAGAAFPCSVDGKAPVRCTSPFRKRFSIGRHVVLITATNSLGIPDPTPAKVAFRIVRR